MGPAVHDAAAAAYLNGEFERALSGFNAAIALNASSALAFYNRGNVYYAKGDYTAATRDFTEALRINPQLPYAHMNRGNAYSNLGMLDEALADLNEAVRLQPDVSDAWFNRAIVHVRRRDLDKGIADYEKAISLDSEDQEAAAARKRLAKLLSGSKGGSAAALDTPSIAREIAHARQVEHLLRLAASTCFAHGDSLDGLKTLALIGKWAAAPSEELTRRSGAGTRMDGGWTFTDRFGTYALIRSTTAAASPVYVCSLTAKPVDPHMFEDMRAGFEVRFAVRRRDNAGPPGQHTSQYLLTGPKGTLIATLVFAMKGNSLTIRSLHGR